MTGPPASGCGEIMEECPGFPASVSVPLPGLISRAGRLSCFRFMTYTITPLIGEQAIAARVRELAASIDADMGDRPYVLLRLLDGAVPFASMLAEHLNPARK